MAKNGVTEFMIKTLINMMMLLNYQKVNIGSIRKDLRIMDSTAASVYNEIKIIVFDMNKKETLKSLLLEK